MSVTPTEAKRLYDEGYTQLEDFCPSVSELVTVCNRLAIAPDKVTVSLNNDERLDLSLQEGARV